MKRIAIMTVILTLLTTFTVGNVDADSNKSKHHKGLGGLSFMVTVTDLYGNDAPKENCYTFNKDGTWIDPLFLEGNVVPGTYVEKIKQNKTTYTVTGLASIGPGDDGVEVGILLTQVGTVKPGHRHGYGHGHGKKILKLEAESTVDVVVYDDPSNIIAGSVAWLKSEGYQVKSCPGDSNYHEHNYHHGGEHEHSDHHFDENKN